MSANMIKRCAELQAELKIAVDALKKIECECGGEEPDGSSPTCYRCEALTKIGGA